MERRELGTTLELADEQLREISGLAVPWNAPAEFAGGNGWREQFAPGSIDAAELIGLPFLYRHGEPVGTIVRAHDTAAGPHVTARIARTGLGNDVLELARERALPGLSVGFDDVPEATRVDQAAKLITRTRVKVAEISAAVFPFYPAAAITGVREHTTPNGAPSMTEPTPTPAADTPPAAAPSPAPAADTAMHEVREQLGAIQSRLNAMPVAEVREGLPFQNEADYWCAYRDAMFGGTEQRERFAAQTRALTAIDTSDTGSAARTSWADDIVHLVSHGRRTVSAIGTKPLPDTGLTVDYLKQTANVDTGDQASQLAEVTSTQYTSSAQQAAVFTEAGASSVSMQLIQRSSPDFLSELMRDYAEAYARRFNARALTLLATGSGAATWDVSTSVTAEDFGAFLADAVGDVITGVGAAPDVFIMGPQLFLTAATVNGYGFPVAGGNVGNADLGSLTFSAFGVTFTCDPAIAGVTGYAVHRESVRIWESPGAPMTLTANVPATLGQDLAVYGYGAVAMRNAAGVSVLTLDTTP